MKVRSIIISINGISFNRPLYFRIMFFMESIGYSRRSIVFGMSIRNSSVCQILFIKFGVFVSVWVLRNSDWVMFDYSRKFSGDFSLVGSISMKFQTNIFVWVSSFNGRFGKHSFITSIFSINGKHFSWFSTLDQW